MAVCSIDPCVCVMGQFLSIKKSREDYYEQVLTELQSEIQKRQQNLNHFRLTLRSVQVHLALVSVIAYGCAVAYCFLQYRLGREGGVLRVLGLIAYPIGVYYLRSGLNWIGGWFIDLRQRQLKDLQQNLKLRLEDLKKETSYYKTRSILERYDESERSKKEAPPKKEKQPSPKSQMKQQTQALVMASTAVNPAMPQPQRPPFQSLQHRPAHLPAPQFKSPTWMDRLMDALIGDDSRNQKYALICQQCYNHNGLAEPEAFAHGIRYRCPNCGFMNTKAPQPSKSPEVEEPRISFAPEEAEEKSFGRRESSSSSASPKKSKKTATKKTNKAD